LPLEALQAKNRSAFHWFEGYFSIGSALGTNSGEHLAGSPGSTIVASVLSAFPATLGFIFETLFLVEFLFTNGEYEFLATILTYQYFVFEHVKKSLAFLKNCRDLQKNPIPRLVQIIIKEMIFNSKGIGPRFFRQPAPDSAWRYL